MKILDLKLDEYTEEWREHLMNISWFMRILKEFSAQQANAVVAALNDVLRLAGDNKTR
ncbi:MAG: hypothetical protein COB30_000095 [Ectothiorhodospiraceae bacterium]|nr:hypothetical protein [Ectothiorhodospiraceae bacterium]